MKVVLQAFVELAKKYGLETQQLDDGAVKVFEKNEVSA
jgi:hypothetical protein